ncbi:MAG: transcriptional repressor [Bacteroidales bacterium]|nr:transcriptional repressor [Bacteroidales bacterium]MCF8344691.1 transcriptional repressor [Bacteroidales bacterium]MCF8351736.1 transcriptional repressor [Bacteroidales bacterium]MCF8376651.1 transcriptional repressor [Bacteroidales bacterium]
MRPKEIKNSLQEKGLKITPQRIVILEAIHRLENHPTAESIIGYIKKAHPNIATGTVYKILNVLVENDLIKRVTTERDIMRYDAVLENHHHLYDKKSDAIRDYFDGELDKLLMSYFEKKKIPNFRIEDIVLEIKGRFKKQ